MISYTENAKKATKTHFFSFINKFRETGKNFFGSAVYGLHLSFFML